ncbi:MAG: methyltransferase domain-containing protein [Candidatus Neomarinimicrobiota bacterium]
MAYSEWKSLQDVDRYARNRYRSWDQQWLDQREQKLVKRIFREHDLSGTILDIPSGYGRFHRLLEAFGTPLSADLGSKPLHYMTETLGMSGESVNCAAEKLPFSDKSVDVIFCFRLMQHIHTGEERKAVLKEFGRVSCRWIVISVYLSNPLHRLLRAVSSPSARITMLSRSGFESDLQKADLTILKKVSVAPGLHAQRVYLLAVGKLP